MLLGAPSSTIDAAPPLQATDVAAPIAARGDVLVRVSVCGVCRTDLDLVEGRLTAPRYPVIPGHQVIGRVERVGEGVTDVQEGDRVGVAWIHSACGRCEWCRTGRENLCPWFRSIGCDENGGYAEYVTVPAAFAQTIPAALSDVAAAPLLCAGAIGWRSLRLTGIVDGQPLGLTGFGASAHLVLQLARQRFPQSPVYVFARNARERDFARELGAAWAGASGEAPPEELDAAIVFAPDGALVPAALAALAKGGTVVCAGIHMSDLPSFPYDLLWGERSVRTVANLTRRDGEEFLALAPRVPVRTTVRPYALERAGEALDDLRAGRITGAAVIRLWEDAATVGAR